MGKKVKLVRMKKWLTHVSMFIPLSKGETEVKVFYEDAPLWKKLILNLVKRYGKCVWRDSLDLVAVYEVPDDVMAVIYKLLSMNNWFDEQLIHKPLDEIKEWVDKNYKRYLAEKAVEPS